MTLKQLEIFNAVVIAGSITKASRRIDLSQPSISQQLAKLEERLGCQLIVRNRTGAVVLTPAGDYWFAASTEMLGRLKTVFSEHDQRFVRNNLTVRMGLTPTMRGRFVSEAARIASNQEGFVKFEVKYAVTSSELVEMLRLHQLNCAIVSDEAVVHDRNAFAITPLFEDHIAWVVPASVQPSEIRAALSTDKSVQLAAPLQHFVDMDPQLSLRDRSLEWYRHSLPNAAATYSASTYPLAVDIVAAGLATAHCPISLLPNLPHSVRQKIHLLRIKDMSRQVVLAMPKHLLSLRSYAQTYNGIAEFCRNEYAAEMTPSDQEFMQVA
ncbi:LysR family transcriptional regulator [Devosia sp. Root635]|uniref:LysR family transcriptional regulator n=1 Tax=Devosia sp. Root635 TaxID=1736575 RepID=UPI0023796909|nr:LysR family transcriptional regulator [Devosia sp. Root635]